MGWLTDAIKTAQTVGLLLWTVAFGPRIVDVNNKDEPLVEVGPPPPASSPVSALQLVPTAATFHYTATNYTGTYALVSLYDHSTQTTLELSPGFTMQLRPSSLDDPYDDQDLYDLTILYPTNGGASTTTTTTDNNALGIVAHLTVTAASTTAETTTDNDDTVQVDLISVPRSETTTTTSSSASTRSIAAVVPYWTQIRFYDDDSVTTTTTNNLNNDNKNPCGRTVLVLGGPPGSIESARVPG